MELSSVVFSLRKTREMQCGRSCGDQVATFCTWFCKSPKPGPYRTCISSISLAMPHTASVPSLTEHRKQTSSSLLMLAEDVRHYNTSL